jgi:hypothetical protein
VEVDVLTGETTILRSDLVYDCGQSLNPAVDLGQVSQSTKLPSKYQLHLQFCALQNHCKNEM